MSLRQPKKVQFRYRLEGFDEKWVEAGTRRTAYYTKVPYGEYRFRVIASNDDGLWNEDGASLAVTVEPRFYETRWFRLAAVVSLLIALTGAYRARIWQLRARERELTKIVGERTEELRGTVEELRRTQEQLARLSEATPEKLENISSWGTSMASEIARAIRALRIGIWRVQGDDLLPVSSGTTKPPSAAVLRSKGAAAELKAVGGETVVPVRGMTGELRGALVIEGPVVWGEVERQLILGFAQHLGGALDLRQMREALTASEARQAAARQRMREQGIQTLKICPACSACYDDTQSSCPTDGSSLDATRLLPLRILGRYRLAALLGEGGMGCVFKARDEKLQRDVALKVIRPERLSDPVVRFRIEREARTLAQIRHPAVAALFDSGELEDGSAFLVMELLDGRDVARMLSDHGPASPVQVGRLLRQAGGALAAAHQAGIIHRDIKPANVFLVKDGDSWETKLLDFGLAMSGEADARLTQTGMVVGTPAYMSPEQAQGLPTDARSDLYSLAAVGYEALTGQRVVPGNDIGILVDVLYKVPALLSSLLPDVPAEVDQAFAAALAKERNGRPRDVLAWTQTVAQRLEAMDAQPGGWPAGFARERPDQAAAGPEAAPTA